MNDYRGVVKARQYGDSYLVLKDVRLRCTMCSTDSGGSGTTLRLDSLGVLLGFLLLFCLIGILCWLVGCLPFFDVSQSVVFFIF